MKSHARAAVVAVLANGRTEGPAHAPQRRNASILPSAFAFIAPVVPPRHSSRIRDTKRRSAPRRKAGLKQDTVTIAAHRAVYTGRHRGQACRLFKGSARSRGRPGSSSTAVGMARGVNEGSRDDRGGSSVGNAEAGREAEEERFIKRLDVAVRRIWAEYYTCSDVRETTECLGVFLNEATRALDAGLSPGEINVRLKAKLIENAQRLDYHLDGDDPMVLYRLWLRGRAIDVYERDLFHCPRWIDLIAETRRQVEADPNVGGDMGTICYPNGDIFEGQVNSLIQSAEESSAHVPSASSAQKDAIDAELSYPFAPADADASFGAAEGDAGLLAPDVTSVSGLVALTLKCLEDGLTDEAAILQRHLYSPDFGHPLLRLASPSSPRVEAPHMPDVDEPDPGLVGADSALTEEHLALGERGAKEMMHDRRRSQLDVYLICAAYRAARPAATETGGRGEAPGDMAAMVAEETGWEMGEEDALILDDLLKKAAAMDS